MQAVASRDVAAAAPNPHHPQRPRRVKPRRRFPPEVLSDAEVRGLLDACGQYHPVALRNRALIALMYRAGLRVSEALALQPKDVDLAAGTLRVLHGKGDRARTVGIDPAAAAIVAAWGEARLALGIPRGAPLVCTLGGLPLVTGYVRRLLPRLAARAGIEKRVHAHGLRHTFITNLVNGGVHPKTAQVLARHCTITLTMDRYTHSLRGAETAALAVLPDVSSASGELRPTGTR